jgi:hypothetical protein
MTTPTVDGSVDLTFLVNAKPWQLAMAAAMLRPYYPVTAAILDLRATRTGAPLFPERRST